MELGTILLRVDERRGCFPLLDEACECVYVVSRCKFPLYDEVAISNLDCPLVDSPRLSALDLVALHWLVSGWLGLTKRAELPS